MKKIIAIIAVMAVMLTFFAACGKKKGELDFSGDNNSKVVAPTGSTANTSSEISSEDKELDDAWGNVSISVDIDSVTSKPASSKPATSKPAATTSQSGSTVTSSQQATSSQATSSKGTTSYIDDDPAFGGWVKPGM